MIEHTAARGAEAAWRRHLDDVAKRNDETVRRAQEDQESRADANAKRRREDAEQEADELAGMNKQLEKRRRRGGRAPKRG